MADESGDEGGKGSEVSVKKGKEGEVAGTRSVQQIPPGLSDSRIHRAYSEKSNR